MRENLGLCPADAKGKRIRGRLRNGTAFGFDAVAGGTPAGWPADGTGACNWVLSDSPFDIVEFEVIS